ncbi:hypothetical protein OH492_08460 [Vibrio chagasii]|nr:hypothetical protein [Vibrio chagasii]
MPSIYLSAAMAKYKSDEFGYRTTLIVSAIELTNLYVTDRCSGVIKLFGIVALFDTCRNEAELIAFTIRTGCGISSGSVMTSNL